MERPCAWKNYTPQQVEELEELCRGYKQFLSENKTERLCVKTGIKMAEEAGYVDLETVIAEGRDLLGVTAPVKMYGRFPACGPPAGYGRKTSVLPYTCKRFPAP